MPTSSARLLIVDSVTHLGSDAAGKVAMAMSHGGRYCGYYAASKGVAAVILHDASVGREDAGISALPYLGRLGVPAATVSAASAQIGDGADGYASGVLSHVNARARALGLKPGLACRAAAERLLAAELEPAREPPAEAEHRHEIASAGGNGIRVFALDSNSLVAPADVGHIIVTGSHGGLLGGKSATAVKYDVLAAVYNDAGRGKGDAGISRLPALDARGIAGACVAHTSARIGDGLSTYDDGVITAVGEVAARRGGRVGQTCKAFVAAVVAAGPRR